MLNDLSRTVRNADATLVPAVTYVRQRRFEDRGLNIAERSAEIVLLLIDTNNGLLLWSGGRQAQISNQLMASTKSPATIDYPPWPDLRQRLLIEALWRDFPGRQTYE